MFLTFPSLEFLLNKNKTALECLLSIKLHRRLSVISRVNKYNKSFLETGQRRLNLISWVSNWIPSSLFTDHWQTHSTVWLQLLRTVHSRRSTTRHIQSNSDQVPLRCYNVRGVLSVHGLEMYFMQWDLIVLTSLFWESDWNCFCSTDQETTAAVIVT